MSFKNLRAKFAHAFEGKAAQYAFKAASYRPVGSHLGVDIDAVLGMAGVPGAAEAFAAREGARLGQRAAQRKGKTMSLFTEEQLRRVHELQLEIAAIAVRNQAAYEQASARLQVEELEGHARELLALVDALPPDVFDNLPRPVVAALAALAAIVR